MLDRRQNFRPKTGEAPFHLDEVFFSRTDDRGIIISGNDVFRRVAHYEWDELIGKPHKVIRHPDMPRGVFWLVWKELKQGNPIGGYVKNQAKDGLHYWVFATMVPFGDGFLSARIKPSSGLLGTVEPIYAEMRKAELEEGLSPEDSANLLLDRLADLGYADYSEFVAQASSRELLSRDKQLGQPIQRDLASFIRMRELADDLTRQTKLLIEQFDAMKTIPHNLRVIASRLEPTGGPVSTLSQNYGTMSREMSQWFETHVLGENSNFSTIDGSVKLAMSMTCMAKTLKECEQQLKKERRSMGANVSINDERTLMSRLVVEYEKKCKSCIFDVVTEAERITNACAVMNRHILGLSTTRVMCKIESARLPDAGDALNDIITQLMTFQDNIKDQLEQIARSSEEIQQLHDG